MIVVFGSLNMDLVMPVRRLPGPGETVLCGAHVAAPGGKGANQAVAAARAGGEVAFAGCVGRDGYGDSLLEAVSAAGVDTRLVAAVEAPTGIAAVCVADDGGNQIVVASGANGAARHHLVGDDLLDAGATLLMQLECPPEEVFALARRARGAGCRVILNAAPAAPVVPEAVDLLVVNEPEALAVARGLDLAAADAESAARRLRDRHRLATVVTRGAQGAVAVTPEGAWRIGALPIRPLDTVGAGDAFCGTLATALDHGMALPDALRAAAVAGSLACLVRGAMPALPDMTAIDARLGELPAAEAIGP